MYTTLSTAAPLCKVKCTSADKLRVKPPSMIANSFPQTNSSLYYSQTSRHASDPQPNPLSGDCISVHQVTSNLTEATRTEHVTTQPKVVTRNITTNTGPKKSRARRAGRKSRTAGPVRCVLRDGCAVSVGCSTAHPSRMNGLSPISTLYVSTLSLHVRDT